MSLETTHLDDLKQTVLNPSDACVHEDLAVIKNYLTDKFMKKVTAFPDLEAFLNAGGFTAATQSDFQSILITDLDAWVQKNSKYATWSEMVSDAGDFYFENQMKEIKFK